MTLLKYTFRCFSQSLSTRIIFPFVSTSKAIRSEPFLSKRPKVITNIYIYITFFYMFVINHSRLQTTSLINQNTRRAGPKLTAVLLVGDGDIRVYVLVFRFYGRAWRRRMYVYSATMRSGFLRRVRDVQRPTPIQHSIRAQSGRDEGRRSRRRSERSFFERSHTAVCNSKTENLLRFTRNVLRSTVRAG